ncbi:MAG: ABC transporter substrate-binding protein [Flavobacteriia bacterium]|nr:ABC transporter substrate-binding protein [Flavobacteriia bacterium]
MKFVTLFISIFGLILLTIVLNSCNVDLAKESPKQFITIYSDCLTPKDRILFKSFRKKNNIHIKICYLSSDSLIQSIKTNKFNSQADLIILKSLTNTYKCQKLDLYNEVHSWKLDELIDKKYSSKNNTWFGIGINPYILITRNKAKDEPEQYTDLISSKYENQWTTNLQSSEDFIPFISPLLRSKKRGNLHKYLQDFNEKQLYLGQNIQAYLRPNFFLTYYATFVEHIMKNDSLKNIFHVNFLNHTSNGTYYNLYTAGIVKQAQNYENAKLLLEYLATNQFNEQLNNKWKTLPISLNQHIHPYEYQNVDFTINKTTISKQVANYTYINSIAKKVKKDLFMEQYSEPIESPITNDSIIIQVNQDSLETI